VLSIVLLRTALALAPAPQSTDQASVVALLAETEREPAPAAAELGARLARLGADAAPELFTALVRGADGEHAPNALGEEALLVALGTLGAAPLRPFFEERLRAEVEPEERQAMLRVLARVAMSPDLGLTRRAAERGGSVGLEPDVQLAVAGLLGRDGRALASVRLWIVQSADALGPALIRAVGDSGLAGALEFCAALLGDDGDLDAVLLSEIGRLADAAPKPLSEAVTLAVTPYLDLDEPQLVREAALALGHAQDQGCVGRLIELLASEERGVRAAAAWSLERCTGLRFREDARRWASWLAGEARWFEAERAALAARLADVPAVALGALGEVARHRLHRHELALELGAALGNEAPEVRRVACLVLARLGSSAAVPALSATLEDEEDSVVRAAASALVALGEPIPEGILKEVDPP